MKARLLSFAGVLALCALLGCTGPYAESPPPAVEIEARVGRPSPYAVWIDGHWAWRGHAYYWVPGYWERHPHGRWVPGNWAPQRRGYVWRRGHWDHRNPKHDDRDRDRDSRHMKDKDHDGG